MSLAAVDEDKNYQSFTVRRVHNRTRKTQQTVINQLKEITGIWDPKALKHAYEASNGDISQAVAFLTDNIASRGNNARPAAQPARAAATDNDNANKSAQTKSTGDVVDLTHDRDEDIQRAIAMSLQQNQPAAGNHTGVTAEEQDISRALEQSIKDPSTGSWFVDPINPYERQRDNSWPVGLKNVGNTCWFSAVIQSLYHLPAFRHMVLSFMPPRYLKDANGDAENSKEHRNLLFMAELRALFALMLGTRRKYVDPTKSVEILKAAFASGSVDDQQDVSEFTHKLLEWLEDAFKSDCSQKNTDPEGGEREAAKKTNPMLDLFYGQFKVEGINEGNNFVNTETFGQYPLRVQGFSNLHESLEASTSHGEIETVNRETNGESAQEQWFTRLPHVLTFELSRFHFNQSMGRPEKIHNNFKFPRTIYMDRYMDINRRRVKVKREELQGLTNQMRELQVKLDRYQCYGAKRCPLTDVLQYTLDFATGHSPDAPTTDDVEMASPARSPDTLAECSSPSRRKQATPSPMKGTQATPTPPPSLGPKHVSDDELMVLQQCLRRWREEVEQDVKGLQDSIDGIRANVDNIFEEEDLKKFEFRLHAVLVHEGQASEGHYWSYIRDHRHNVWLKFNDISVGVVDWDELERESIGGSGNASAYCLMYVDSSRQELLQDFPTKSDSETVLNHLADDLKQLVLEDNKQFQHELRQWDQKKNQAQTVRPEQGMESKDDRLEQETESTGTSAPVPDKNQRPRDRHDAPVSSFSTPHSSMSVQASRQAISKSQNVFIDKGPEAALNRACEQEVERLQAVAQTPTGPEEDVRLRSCIVYFMLNNAPHFVIERSVLEQFADQQLNYNIQSQAMRKMASRRLEQQRLSDLQRNQYQMWHDEYNNFIRCTAFFVYAVKVLYQIENCHQSLPYIVHACRLGDGFFDISDPHKRQSPALLAFCRRQNLLHLSEQCAAQLESGDKAEIEQGLEAMKELVVPCVALLTQSASADDTVVVEDVRKKWCSFLGQDVTETVQDKLQDLLTRLIDNSPDTVRIKAPPLELKEKKDLAEKYTQAIHLIKQNDPSAPI